MNSQKNQPTKTERMSPDKRHYLPGIGVQGCKVFIKTCAKPFHTDINQAITSCIRAKYIKV